MENTPWLSITLFLERNASGEKGRGESGLWTTTPIVLSAGAALSARTRSFGSAARCMLGIVVALFGGREGEKGLLAGGGVGRLILILTLIVFTQGKEAKKSNFWETDPLVKNMDLII